MASNGSKFDFFTMIQYNTRMKKSILIFLILLLIATPLLVATASSDDSLLKKGDTGSEVYALQRRLNELGYLNYRPTGKFSDMTTQAVMKFQQLNSIPADGRISMATKQAIFAVDAIKNSSNPKFKKIIGKAYTGTNKDKGMLSSWEKINQIFQVGDEVLVTDYNTEIEFTLKRVGGVHNAQVVTVSDSDFDNYTEVFGGGETWEHRAVLVEINGTKYAASLFGMPTHTEPQSESGMNGYTILYFNSSNTDVYALTDDEHANAITRISA